MAVLGDTYEAALRRAELSRIIQGTIDDRAPVWARYCDIINMPGPAVGELAVDTRGVIQRLSHHEVIEQAAGMTALYEAVEHDWSLIGVLLNCGADPLHVQCPPRYPADPTRTPWLDAVNQTARWIAESGGTERIDLGPDIADVLRPLMRAAVGLDPFGKWEPDVAGFAARIDLSPTCLARCVQVETPDDPAWLLLRDLCRWTGQPIPSIDRVWSSCSSSSATTP